MDGDTKVFWDEIWQQESQDSPHFRVSPILVAELADVPPGNALDVGCGSGSDAIWLAKQGWRVTALDFSTAGIDVARRNSMNADVDIECIEADAAAYRPETAYDLITSFYIQLPPARRVAMFANICSALKPGGRLLFVSHDRSTPIEGWTEEEHLATLTDADEIAAELLELGLELQIERAVKVADQPPTEGEEHGHHGHGGETNSTVVVARAK